jgi:hypothetical protein
VLLDERGLGRPVEDVERLVEPRRLLGPGGGDLGEDVEVELPPMTAAQLSRSDA